MRGKYYECRYVAETRPCYECGKAVQYVHVVGVKPKACAEFCGPCAERLLVKGRGITPLAESLMRDRVSAGDTTPVTEDEAREMYLS